MKKKLLMAVVVSMLAAITFGGIASAHVHGITPLLDISVVDNSVTGGNGTNGTPADDANGGPISGLIPSGTGSSTLSGGDGGRFAIADSPATP